MWVLFSVVGLGCSDYALQGAKSDQAPNYGDTDPVPPGTEWDACYLLTMDKYTGLVEGNGAETPDVCVGRAQTVAHHVDVTAPQVMVEGLEGTQLSAAPSDCVDVDGVAVDPSVYVVSIQENGEGLYTFPDDDNLLSGLVPVSGFAGAWTGYINSGRTTDGDLGALNSCAADCTFEPAVAIPDVVRAQQAPPPETGGCGDYEPLRVCYQWHRTDASAKTTINSTCTAGSGTFRLLPWELMDKDADGAITGVFRAVQTSGTGVLTNGAWITSITPEQLHGQALRPIRVNAQYAFGADDRLENEGLVSLSVPAQGRTFASGVVAGAAPFVITEAPGTAPTDLSVTMAWSCRVPATSDIVLSEPGFAFTPAQIGCGVTWPQAFVVRPLPAMAPRELVFSLYGSVSNQVTVPLIVSGSSRTFQHSYGALAMSGELLSWGGSGAVVRFDSLSFRGASICQPGTYTLLPE